MRTWLHRIFLEHPASIGETYLQHATHAAGFGAQMLKGAVASFIHAAIPSLCTHAGSTIIAHLHERMIQNRRRLGVTTPGPTDEVFLAEHI